MLQLRTGSYLKLLFIVLLVSFLLSACKNLEDRTIPENSVSIPAEQSSNNFPIEQPDSDYHEQKKIPKYFDSVGYDRFVMRFIDSQEKDTPVPGAKVIFEKNGQKIRSITDSNGFVEIRSFPFTEEDDKLGRIKYTVQANGYDILEDKSPCFQREIGLSKTIKKQGTYRIVLSWGKRPLDIDSHLWFKDNHVYYHSKKGTRPNMFSDLDRDDIDSFGPETTTIRKVFRNENYLFAVHDYTNRKSNSSKRLSFSDARVVVYAYNSNRPIKKFYIPKNVSGTIWYVFYFNKNFEIKEINTFDYKVKGGDKFPYEYMLR